MKNVLRFPGQTITKTQLVANAGVNTYDGKQIGDCKKKIELSQPGIYFFCSIKNYSVANKKAVPKNHSNHV